MTQPLYSIYLANFQFVFLNCLFQTNYKRVDLSMALLKQTDNGLFYSVRSSAAPEINATRGLFQLCLRLVQVIIIMKKKKNFNGNISRYKKQLDRNNSVTS